VHTQDNVTCYYRSDILQAHFTTRNRTRHSVTSIIRALNLQNQATRKYYIRVPVSHFRNFLEPLVCQTEGHLHYIPQEQIPMQNVNTMRYSYLQYKK
jgi:hypothetical protein